MLDVMERRLAVATTMPVVVLEPFRVSREFVPVSSPVPLKSMTPVAEIDWQPAEPLSVWIASPA